MAVRLLEIRAQDCAGSFGKLLSQQDRISIGFPDKAADVFTGEILDGRNLNHVICHGVILPAFLPGVRLAAAC